MTELVGQSLGQYQITAFIAKGGMATVYRARQASIGRDVAVKVLPPNFTHDDTFIERFNREVAVIAKLQHPHILPVIDYGEYEGLPYIVMAYINGGTLGDRITAGNMEMPEFSRVVRQVAEALDFAHQHGIVHRDFKPGNILLDAQGNSYLADFGLAKITETASDLTGAAVLGTPTYMAPEQIQQGEVTSAADLYAFAVTIYQMLAGQSPYDSSSPSGVLLAHITQPVPNILDVQPSLPQEVRSVMERALAKNPAERYPTATELADHLFAALEGKKLSAITSEVHQAPQPALLMTNMLGHVIFVDQQCLHLLKRRQHDARQLIGKPMENALGMDRKVAKKILQEINKRGEVNALEMQITDASGKKKPVLCSAVGTRDDDGKFVGADITLQPLTEATGSFDPAVDETKMDTQERSYLQTYFKVQMQALYAMLLQWAGRGVAANLEDIINETGQRNAWPVQMEDGKALVELRHTDIDVYQALLARGMAYAASIIGNNIVIKELEHVNQQTDPVVMGFVQAMGLDELYKDIL